MLGVASWVEVGSWVHLQSAEKQHVDRQLLLVDLMALPWKVEVVLPLLEGALHRLEHEDQMVWQHPEAEGLVQLLPEF